MGTEYWEISQVCCHIARVPQAQVTIWQQTSDVSQYTVNNVYPTAITVASPEVPAPVLVALVELGKALSHVQPLCLHMYVLFT